MDDLNMANGQPTAELPPEPSTGENAPAAVQPAAEMPALDIAPETPTPVAQEPVAQEPVAQEPVAQEPVAQEPVAQEPVAQEPVVQEPVVQAIVEETKEKPVEVTEEKPVEGQKSDKMDWFILKVQSNREESIREGLMRRVAIAGLDYFFGEIIVPTEKVTEFKGGKKKVIKRKLYPGYLVVHMEINDDTWFLVRETPGIGDFTGAAGHPSPMLPHEVARIVAKQEEKSEKAPKLKIAFREGERVKIKEGTFESFEGDVDSIDETNGRVTVMINIFGRSTPVELEYWQIEAL
jgi:transcriptional antiterminator NusG